MEVFYRYLDIWGLCLIENFRRKIKWIYSLYFKLWKLIRDYLGMGYDGNDLYFYLLLIRIWNDEVIAENSLGVYNKLNI